MTDPITIDVAADIVEQGAELAGGPANLAISAADLGTVQVVVTDQYGNDVTFDVDPDELHDALDRTAYRRTATDPA